MSIQIVDFSTEKNVLLGRQCLELIRDIAARGAASKHPGDISFALQDLTEVLASGIEERRVDSLPISVIADLEDLVKGLECVDYDAQTIAGWEGRNAAPADRSLPSAAVPGYQEG